MSARLTYEERAILELAVDLIASGVCPNGQNALHYACNRSGDDDGERFDKLIRLENLTATGWRHDRADAGDLRVSALRRVLAESEHAP